MQLFHGSSNIIEQPVFGGGKLHNDYGRGFYCTKSYDMACEWAVDVDRDGVVNQYEIDARELKVLDLNSHQYTVINWLAILLANREFDIQSDFGSEAKQYLLANFLVDDYDKYDLIIGNRADDRYFSFAQDFLNNVISVRTLSRAMHLGELGEQVVLKSSKAFETIKYVSYTDVKRSEWYFKKSGRDTGARKQYDDMRREPWTRGETYMLQIIEEEIRNNDERLRL